MTAGKSKRLVIDASVAHAAGGEEASHPTSKSCRDFLLTVLTICHHVVVTPEIGEEWRRHRSVFALRWLRSMAARKKVHRLESVISSALRGKIERSTGRMKSAEREALRKDFLLVEAAVATDRVVIALDDKVRALFVTVSRSVGELGNIAWVNPAREEEDSIVWLENGARPEKRRLLSGRGD